MANFATHEEMEVDKPLVEVLEGITQRDHRGTFAGFDELLKNSLTKLLKTAVKNRKQEFDEDGEISQKDMLTYLGGAGIMLPLKGRFRVYATCPQISLLPEKSHEFLTRFIDAAGAETDTYEFIANFQAIRIPLGEHGCLIFNPTSSKDVSAFDDTVMTGWKEGYRCVFR